MVEEEPKYLVYFACYNWTTAKNIRQELADNLGLGFVIAEIRAIPKTELKTIGSSNIKKMSPEVTRC